MWGRSRRDAVRAGRGLRPPAGPPGSEDAGADRSYAQPIPTAGAAISCRRSSSIVVTAGNVVDVLGIASTVAFCVIAALTIRDWLATKDTTRMYLALAISCLGVVSILGQAAKLLGTWFAGLNSVLTITIFLGSGLALLLFRDSVIPLARRTRRVVIFVVAATASLEVGVALAGSSSPKALQLLATLAFVLVWCGCVGEPSVRLWLAARRRTAVQLARMRA